jgi:pilus assembly protein CpaB
VPDGNDPKAEQQMLAAADTRPIAGPDTYSTGADVSRFQRGTVPGKPQNADSQTAGAGSGAATVQGPVVRVARGSAVTIVPVGGK